MLADTERTGRRDSNQLVDWWPRISCRRLHRWLASSLYIVDSIDYIGLLYGKMVWLAVWGQQAGVAGRVQPPARRPLVFNYRLADVLPCTPEHRWQTGRRCSHSFTQPAFSGKLSINSFGKFSVTASGAGHRHEAVVRGAGRAAAVGRLPRSPQAGRATWWAVRI